MSVIMTYLFVFYVFVTTKKGYGSAWSNRKQEFYLSLRSPFAIFVTTKIGCGSAWSNWKQEFRLSLRSPFAIFA